MKSVREAIERVPAVDRNALDRASFYVEALKYGPGPGKLELAGAEEIVAQLDTLLRDAGVKTSMTGEELLEAIFYYGDSLSHHLGTTFRVGVSMFLDGLMHGIAFGAGLDGEPRDPKGE